MYITYASGPTVIPFNIQPDSENPIIVQGFFDALTADLAGIPGELYLNVSYILRHADGLLPAGTEVACDQILLREAPYRMTAADLRGRRWTADFDPKTGALCSYKLEGKELVGKKPDQILKDGISLVPEDRKNEGIFPGMGGDPGGKAGRSPAFRGGGL